MLVSAFLARSTRPSPATSSFTPDKAPGASLLPDSDGDPVIDLVRRMDDDNVAGRETVEDLRRQPRPPAQRDLAQSHCLARSDSGQMLCTVSQNFAE